MRNCDEAPRVIQARSPLAFSPLPCAFLSVFHIPISDTELHRENTEITEKQ